MWKTIFTILLVAAICHAAPKTKSRAEERAGIPIFDATAFDYDSMYNVESRAAPAKPQQSPTTNDGLLLRYWNNFVRSVRLPIPRISWNMTYNPLTNMFNAGASNILETPVSNYTPSKSSKKRRRKSSRKHKHSTKSKKGSKRRHQDPVQDDDAEIEDDDEQVPEQDVDVYAPITRKPPVVLQPYPEGTDLNNAMYLYDPNSHQFYAVQRLHSPYDTQSNYYPTGSYHDVGQSGEEDENEVAEELDSDIETSTAVPVKRTSIAAPNKHEDVSVVETFDDDDDDRKLNGEKSNTEEESLRNAIGSYMNEDDFSRRRQQAVYSKGTEKKRVKQTPKRSLKYFFLKL